MVLGGVYWGGVEVGKYWDGRRQKWVPWHFSMYLMTTGDQSSYSQVEKEPKKIKFMVMEGRFLR